MLEDRIGRAAERIRGATSGMALTGAGVSVESGIPDFRSPGGLWERFDPMVYATIEAFRADPVEVWKMLAELERTVLSARPNPAHVAIAELERRRHLRTIVTQNIDGLHQVAGSRNVVEFHGSGRRLVCLDCGASMSREEFGPVPPRCDSCGAVMKPDILLFHEAIPEAAFERAAAAAESADLILVIGTSAEVWPAADLPRQAAARGAYVIEVNLEETLFGREVADLSLVGPAGEVLPALLEIL